MKKTGKKLSRIFWGDRKGGKVFKNGAPNPRQEKIPLSPLFSQIKFEKFFPFKPFIFKTEKK